MFHRRGGALPCYRRFAKNTPKTLAATLATFTFRAKPSRASIAAMTSCPQIVNINHFVMIWDFSHLAVLAVGAGTKGDGCEFKRGQVRCGVEPSLGRGVEEA